jgi:tRNA threonylcarbamoyladenosine biosynthesis protein TsaB
MSVVLGIDTAGPVIGAALVGEGEPRQWASRIARGADGVLLPAIADLLAGSARLDAVAVSTGPGAFTGLRVGVATALGIAVSRNVPVVCVGSLEARAAMCEGAAVLAALDARKSRMYAQWFDCSGSEPRAISDAVDRAMDEVLGSMPDSVETFVAVGEGVLVEQTAVEASGGGLIADAGQSPAWAVALLGQRRLSAALPAEEVALRYLRDADAKKTVDRR